MSSIRLIGNHAGAGAFGHLQVVFDDTLEIEVAPTALPSGYM
jgi:hypothetical protein